MITTINHREMGELNRSAVLAELYRSAPLSRSEIALRTGLTGATVSRSIQKFIDVGLIREGAHARTDSPGRRHVGLVINGEAAYFLAVALTARPEIAIVNALNRSVAKEALEEFQYENPEAGLQQICATAKRLIETSGLTSDRIIACGIASTGVVDSEEGKLLQSLTLGWENVPIASLLSDDLGMPVSVEGLSNAFNLAECRFGGDISVDSSVLLHASLGIGASLTIGGQVVRGKDLGLSEIGNKPFALANARLDMPHRATLNQISGGRGVLLRLLQDEAARRDVMTCSATEAWYRYQKELEQAMSGRCGNDEAFQGSGHALGLAIAPMLQFVRPDSVILAGTSFQVQTFHEGFKAATLWSIPDMGDWCTIRLCTMSRSTAAGWLAIHEALLVEGMWSKRGSPA